MQEEKTRPDTVLIYETLARLLGEQEGVEIKLTLERKDKKEETA